MRGLLMIEPLYHQTIRGLKTQTRRSGGLEAVNENPDGWTIFNGGVYLLSPEMAHENFKAYFNEEKPRYGTPIAFLQFIGNGHGMFNPVECKPRYKVGEILYLKEPWITTNPTGEIIYKFGQKEPSRSFFKFKNKLFMPAEAARAFVRITGIKCERLLDISDEDCVAEGIVQHNSGNLTLYEHPKADGPHYTDSPKDAFVELYKFANKVKEVPNIFVWAYTFEYLKDYKP